MKKGLAIWVLLWVTLTGYAQLTMNGRMCPELSVNGEVVLTAPEEGLWGVAAGWSKDWPTDWQYANPDSTVQSGACCNSICRHGIHSATTLPFRDFYQRKTQSFCTFASSNIKFLCFSR